MNESICPACGDPIDFCQGHGEIGDPIGAKVLFLHDEGDHTSCHTDAECVTDRAQARLGNPEE